MKLNDVTQLVKQLGDSKVHVGFDKNGKRWYPVKNNALSIFWERHVHGIDTSRTRLTNTLKLLIISGDADKSTVVNSLNQRITVLEKKQGSFFGKLLDKIFSIYSTKLKKVRKMRDELNQQTQVRDDELPKAETHDESQKQGRHVHFKNTVTIINFEEDNRVEEKALGNSTEKPAEVQEEAPAPSVLAAAPQAPPAPPLPAAKSKAEIPPAPPLVVPDVPPAPVLSLVAPAVRSTLKITAHKANSALLAQIQKGKTLRKATITPPPEKKLSPKEQAITARRSAIEGNDDDDDDNEVSYNDDGEWVEALPPAPAASQAPETPAASQAPAAPAAQQASQAPVDRANLLAEIRNPNVKLKKTPVVTKTVNNGLMSDLLNKLNNQQTGSDEVDPNTVDEDDDWN